MQISIISLLAFGISAFAVPAPTLIRALTAASITPTVSTTSTTPVIPDISSVVSSEAGLVPTIASSVIPEITPIISSAIGHTPTTLSALSSATALVIPIVGATGGVPPPPVLTTGDGAKLIQVEGPNSNAPPSLLMSTEYDIKDAIVFGSEK